MKEVDDEETLRMDVSIDNTIGLVGTCLRDVEMTFSND